MMMKEIAIKNQENVFFCYVFLKDKVERCHHNDVSAWKAFDKFYFFSRKMLKMSYFGDISHTNKKIFERGKHLKFMKMEIL